MFIYFGDVSKDKNSANAKAQEKLDKDLLELKEAIENIKKKTKVKEIDIPQRDEIAVNEEYAKGVITEDENILIRDRYKYYSLKIIKRDSDNDILLSGAEFEIYEDKGFTIPAVFYDKEGNIINKDNKRSLKYTTVNGVIFTDYLRCDPDKVYYIKESKAPDGYLSISEDDKKDNDEISFMCTGADIEDTVIYTDGAVETEINDENMSHIFISKKDVTGSVEIEGCMLEITDSKGDIVKSWTSGDKPYEIWGLNFEEEYVLSEKRPADGYATADSIKFKLRDNKEDSTTKVYICDDNHGEIEKDSNIITMVDESIYIRFYKVDTDTGRKLSGAKLEVRDTKGNTVLKFVSKRKGYLSKGELIAGETYILHEVSAPNGYIIGSDIRFTVIDTGDEQIVKLSNKKAEVTLGKSRRRSDKDRKTIKRVSGHINTPITGRFLEKGEDLDTSTKEGITNNTAKGSSLTAIILLKIMYVALGIIVVCVILYDRIKRIVRKKYIRKRKRKMN